ncbi:MAG: hypothetical protein JO328_12795 [Hyphomicrobiales bacterium]|nr:hypothetical protein [Hyphomicrobiales bacterium]
MPFQPGQSGNPAGRPRGSRNKKTIVLEALVDGEAEEVMQKVIAFAKMGHDAAMRLCVERMMPPRRERPVPLALPRIETDADARQATADVIEALAEGEVTPKEAEQVLRTIAGAAVILQSSEVAARLSRIEQRLPDPAGEAPRQITAAS